MWHNEIAIAAEAAGEDFLFGVGVVRRARWEYRHAEAELDIRALRHFEAVSQAGQSR